MTDEDNRTRLTDPDRKMSQGEMIALEALKNLIQQLAGLPIHPGDIAVALAAQLGVVMGNITDDDERAEGLAIIIAEIPAMVESVAEQIRHIKEAGPLNVLPDHMTKQ